MALEAVSAAKEFAGQPPPTHCNIELSIVSAWQSEQFVGHPNKSEASFR